MLAESVPQPTDTFFPIDMGSMARGLHMGAVIGEHAAEALTEADLAALPADHPLRYLLELRARPDLAAFAAEVPDDIDVAAYRAGVRLGAGIIAFREQQLEGLDAPITHPAFDPDKGPRYSDPPQGRVRRQLPWRGRAARRYDPDRPLDAVADEYSVALLGVLKTVWAKQGRFDSDKTGVLDSETDAYVTRGLFDVLHTYVDLHGAPKREHTSDLIVKRNHIRADQVNTVPIGPQPPQVMGINDQVLNEEYDAAHATFVNDAARHDRRSSGYSAYVLAEAYRVRVNVMGMRLERDAEPIEQYAERKVWWNTIVPVGSVISGVHWYDSRYVFLDPGSTDRVVEVTSPQNVEWRALGKRDKLIGFNGRSDLIELSYPFAVAPEITGDDKMFELLRVCMGGSAHDLQDLTWLAPEPRKAIDDFTAKTLEKQLQSRRYSRVANFMLSKVLPSEYIMETLAPILPALATIVASPALFPAFDEHLPYTGLPTLLASHFLISWLRNAIRFKRRIRHMSQEDAPHVEPGNPGQDPPPKLA